MEAAVLAALFAAFLVTVAKAKVNVAGTVFARADLDDKSFTDNLCFLSTAASVLACAKACALDPSCLTFTFHPDGPCQGHDSLSLELSGAHVVSEGARSFSKLTAQQEQWTVILRRQDGSEDFYRTWDEYREGFGNVTGEYWMGLEAVYQMTSQQAYLLTVDLEDWEGNAISARYSNFSVSSEDDFYRLSDVVFLGGAANDSLDYHIGQPFSTHDVDNDIRSKKNCAEKLHGAWWYKGCAKSNLCGRYFNSSLAPDNDGISWRSWSGHTGYSMKSVLMKIRPEDY